jgi:hypothetical protein
MKKPLSLTLLLSSSLFAALPTVSFAQKASKPNVIYIYADDLGFGDLSSYGAKQIETPTWINSPKAAYDLPMLIVLRQLVPLPFCIDDRNIPGVRKEQAFCPEMPN